MSHEVRVSPSSVKSAVSVCGGVAFVVCVSWWDMQTSVREFVVALQNECLGLLDQVVDH